MQRQGGFVQHVAHVQAGDGHLGGGHHPEVLLRVVVEVVAELGELPGGEEGLGLDHEGQVLLAVALADVQVEHPGDEGALEAGAGPAEDVEARAGDLDALLEVEDAELGAQLPVRQGGEVECLGLAHGADGFVVVLAVAVGNGSVDQVGDGRNERGEVFIDLADAFVQGGDLFAHDAHGLDFGLALGGVLALADFLRDGVALGFERLDAGEQGAALGVQFENPVDHGGVAAPAGEGLADDFGGLADQVDI